MPYCKTYVVAPLDLVDPRIGTNFAIHVDIVAFGNGVRVNTAAKAQSNLGWI